MKSPHLPGALLALTLGLVPAAAAQTATPPTETALTRESTLSLSLDAPAEARELVVAHTLPSGAAYVPGSALLNGTVLDDPVVGPSGRLYWILPGALRGVLQYRVSHTVPLGALGQPGLLARYGQERQEVLSGGVDLLDLVAAAPSASVAENPGAVKRPLAGTEYRERDRITVVVEGKVNSDLTLTVNGAPIAETSIGQRTTDPATGTERREYIGVKLREGVNRLAANGSEVMVSYAGPTQRIEVTPLQLQADGSTPLRLRIRALDAQGVPTAQPFVTIRPNLEPLGGDANPQDAGYQVRLTDGAGVLELRPQALPTRLTLDAQVGDVVQREAFDVTPDPARVGVGHASVTFGITALRLDHWQAAGYYEGMVGRGKLYVTAASQGLPSGETFGTRFPTYGDASTETVPLQGVDPVAFRYEHPDFSAGYRQGAVPVDVLPVDPGFTALTASTRGDTRVSGFAALVPEEQVHDALTPDGTRLYHLTRAPISPDSETVQVVTTERIGGKELTRVTLVRHADYTLDPDTGVLTLIAPLSRVDGSLNPVTLAVSYRTAAPLSNRALAWGAQVKTEQGPLTAGAAVVGVDGQVTVGAKVTYMDGTVSAAAGAAYSGGVQASADATTRLGAGEAHVRVRYQDERYTGVGAFEPGLTVGAGGSVALTDALGVAVDGAYHAQDGEAGGSIAGVVKLQRGSVAASAGLKAGFGSEAGVTAIGSVGLRGSRFGVDVAHNQPLGVGAATTSIGTSFALTPSLTLTARDSIDWQEGQRPSVGLTGRLGGMNFSANYDLPNASGDGNRARFGVDTARSLTDRVSVGLAATEIYDLQAGVNEFSVSPSVRYKTDAVAAGIGADFALKAGVMKTVLRGGLTLSASERLTLSADGLAELGAAPGARVSASGAYRSGEVNALGVLRYQQGSLAGGHDELAGEVQAEVHRSGWGARAGVAGRALLDDPGSLTWQGTLGATAHVAPSIGLGLVGRALFQPSTQTAQYSLGLEASVRALPGTWLTLGYNPTGFTGIGTAATQPGLYLRMDLLLDEQTGAPR